MESYSMFSPEFEGLRPDKQIYLIDRGGVDRTVQRVTVQGSASNTSATFNLNPPSPATIIDRRMMARFTIKAVVSGLRAGVTDDSFLDYGKFAPRANPIQAITSNLELVINGQTSITENPYLQYQALQRYGTSADDRSRFSSIAPTMLDNTAYYEDAKDGLSDPLGTYKNVVNQTLVPRGAYPFKNSVDTTRLKTVVTYEIAHWVDIGPFKSTFQEGEGGISNVQTMQLTYTFGQLSNFLSYGGTGEIANDEYRDIQVVDIIMENQSISMLTTTPPPDFRIPPSLDFGIEQYHTFTTTSNETIPYDDVKDLASSNVQLNTIPKFIYVWVTEQDGAFNDPNRKLRRTDTVLPIEGITISFDNKSGILSSASAKDLYHMSQENGLVSSWPQFQAFYPEGGDGSRAFRQVPTVGSHLCLKFGKDIALNYPQAVGMAGSWNLQVVVKVRGNRPVDPADVRKVAYRPQLNIMTCNDAILTVSLDSTRVTTGLVSSDMVVNSPMYDMTGSQVAAMEGGARSGRFKNFFTSGRFDKFAEVGKNIGRAVAPRLTASLEGVGQAARGVASAARGDMDQYAATESAGSLRAGGFREGASTGGALKGGRYVSNAALKQRLLK